MFKLEIETDNDAFADGAHSAIASMLRIVAQRMDRYPDTEVGKIRDINGNTVGRWEFTP